MTYREKGEDHERMKKKPWDNFLLSRKGKEVGWLWARRDQKQM